MPVKVEQINEYLFSDTVQSQKTKSGSGEISLGQYRGKMMHKYATAFKIVLTVVTKSTVVSYGFKFPVNVMSYNPALTDAQRL